MYDGTQEFLINRLGKNRGMVPSHFPGLEKIPGDDTNSLKLFFSLKVGEDWGRVLSIVLFDQGPGQFSLVRDDEIGKVLPYVTPERADVIAKLETVRLTRLRHNVPDVHPGALVVIDGVHQAIQEEIRYDAGKQASRSKEEQISGFDRFPNLLREEDGRRTKLDSLNGLSTVADLNFSCRFRAIRVMRHEGDFGIGGRDDPPADLEEPVERTDGLLEVAHDPSQDRNEQIPKTVALELRLKKPVLECLRNEGIHIG